MVFAEHLLILEATFIRLEVRLEYIFVLEHSLLGRICLQLVCLLPALLLDDHLRMRRDEIINKVEEKHVRFLFFFVLNSLLGTQPPQSCFVSKFKQTSVAALCLYEQIIIHFLGAQLHVNPILSELDGQLLTHGLANKHLDLIMNQKVEVLSVVLLEAVRE